MRRSTGIAPRTTRSRHSTPARLPPPFAAACRAMRSPAVSAATAVTCSIRSASTSTTRRASSTCDWRHAVTYGLDAFQDNVVTADLRGTSDVTTPGGQRTVSGGFVQWKAELHLAAGGGRRVPLRQLPAGIGDRVLRRRPLVAEDHGRSDAGGGVDALCQLCRRLPRPVDHRDAGQRPACRRYRQRLVLPLSVGYAGTRRRFDILLSCPIRTCAPRSARTRRSAST